MNLPDQATLLEDFQKTKTALEAMTAERDTALSLATERESTLQAVTAERDNARLNVTKLEGERDQVAADLTTARQTIGTLTADRDSALKAKTDAEAQLTDFNAKVASEVRRLGLAKTPAPTAADNTKPKTATERVLEAKGVTSLAEIK